MYEHGTCLDELAVF